MKTPEKKVKWKSKELGCLTRCAILIAAILASYAATYQLLVTLHQSIEGNKGNPPAVAPENPTKVDEPIVSTAEENQ